MRYPKSTPWERIPPRWQRAAIASLEAAAAELEGEISYYERRYSQRSERPLQWMSSARCTARACRAAAKRLVEL